MIGCHCVALCTKWFVLWCRDGREHQNAVGPTSWPLRASARLTWTLYMMRSLRQSLRKPTPLISKDVLQVGDELTRQATSHWKS